MNQVIEVAISFTCIGGVLGTAIHKLVTERDKPIRTESDKLISILESMVFVLLHSESNFTRRMVASKYRSIEREAKNDGLTKLEGYMKAMHEDVAKWHERKDKTPDLHGRWDD